MPDIGKILTEHYGLKPLDIRKSTVGAGSDTYFVKCRDDRYVVKFPSCSEMNNPEAEPALCEYLLKRGVAVSRFIKNTEGSFISRDEADRVFHVQRFIEGKTYDLNTAPDWLLRDAAATLGRIHRALEGYEGLPEGIGPGFFRFMTPKRAVDSYNHSLKRAEEENTPDIAEEIRFRIELLSSFPDYHIDLGRLTCSPTHGDYFISQFICGEDKINAVIDWTTACCHPVIWEIIRSYVYAAPECAAGELDAVRLGDYIGEYLRFAHLNREDIEMMAKLFYYQIAVCDYYGQYYGSAADNRQIYLHQARFSTGLMRWFEKHEPELTRELVRRFT